MADKFPNEEEQEEKDLAKHLDEMVENETFELHSEGHCPYRSN